MNFTTISSSTSKKRIVFFTAALEQGGAERVISILTKYLAGYNFHVEILLYYNRPVLYPIHLGVKITSVEKETGSKNILKNLFWMRKFFKMHADIVISFLASFNILAVFAHLGLSSILIVADRVDPWFVPSHFILRKIRDFSYRLADGVTVQTQHNKAYFPSAVQKRTAVIYNPIDLGDKRGQALHTPKQNKIVCVGRLKSQKNHALLLKSFTQIQADFPTFKLVFYGEGPEKSNLQETVCKLGLEKHVYFAGNIKNLFDEIADAKLFVLCSNYEGMSNALAEAMCLGLPVISTDVSGAAELIENGKSGFVIPKNSQEALTQTMKKILTNETLQKQLGQQAVKLNEQLKVSTIVKQWVDFIQKMERQ